VAEEGEPRSSGRLPLDHLHLSDSLGPAVVEGQGECRSHGLDVQVQSVGDGTTLRSEKCFYTERTVVLCTASAGQHERLLDNETNPANQGLRRRRRGRTSARRAGRAARLGATGQGVRARFRPPLCPRPRGGRPSARCCSTPRTTTPRATWSPS